ncbi:hypothetical protein F6X40_09385 [Paraburkholderia sp. UCT31]|uniref:hypothetical protein n=1 Tax=Paraburkholderia sp. UCT31 TaxID=2615209 RepID=UPI001656599D|nr:hypothetical protein [Paraburkholderia sp. UCT31]MBC8737020.1 hypothetical protein [Paraburkholderia sp. UCT31]
MDEYYMQGGGGSSYASPTATGVSLIGGSGAVAPNTSSPDYAPGIAAGGVTAGSTAQVGGNGRVVVTFQ